MAKQQGFQRDVTTPISIPQVQAPDFNQNRSTVEDIADVASFGLQVFDMVSSANKEAKRVENLAAADTSVNTLINEYNSILAQPKGSLQAANAFAQRRISSLPNSGYVREQFSKGILATRQDFKSGQAEVKPEQDIIDVASAGDKLFISDIMLSTGETVIPAKGTPERDTLMVSLQGKQLEAQIKQNKLAALAVKVEKTEADREELIEIHGEQFGGVSRAVLNEADEIRDRIKQLPLNEQAEALADLDQTVTIMEQEFMRTGRDLLGSKPTDSEIKSLQSKADNLFGLSKAASLEYRNASAKALTWAMDNKKLTLQQSGNLLFAVKQQMGEAAFGMSLLNFISTDPSETVIASIAKGFDITPQQQASIDTQGLVDYVAGGNRVNNFSDVPQDPKKKSELFTKGFNFFKKLTVEGDLGSLEGEDMTRASAGIINVLNDANSQDPATSRQIIEWVGDSDMTTFIDKLSKTEPEKAKAIKNMMITTSRESLKSSGGVLEGINANPESYTFDANTGQFKVVGGLPLAKDIHLGTGMGIPDLPRGFSKEEAEKVVAKANKSMRLFMENKDANPALGELSNGEALHWLLKSGSGPVSLSDNVTLSNGKLTQPTIPEEQIRNMQTISEFKAEIDRQTNASNESGVLLQQAKDIRSAGIPEQDKQLELLSAIRAEKDPAVRIKMLEELDKLDAK